MSESKRSAVIIFLILFLSYGYFFQSGKWNANTRLNQTRAIVELQQLNIDPFRFNTGDVVEHKGMTYPDKAPGASLVATGPWWFFSTIAEMFSLDPEKEIHFICYFTILFTVGLLSAIAGTLLFLVLCQYTASQTIAAALTLSYSLGTIAFPFSTLFFGHQLAASLLLISFSLIFLSKERARGWNILIAGLCTGYAVTTEYPTAIAAGPLAIYCLAVLPRKSLFIFFALGGIIGGSFLLTYNWLVFDKALLLSYSLYTEMEQTLFSDYKTGFYGFHLPDAEILYKITFDAQRGLFFCNPWLIALIPALLLALRSKNNSPETILSLSIVMLYFAFNASFGESIAAWGGAHSVGPRHLVPMLPFAVIAIAPLCAIRMVWWILSPLMLISCAIMLMATAVEPRVSEVFFNPVVDVYWRHFLRGHFASYSGGIFNSTFLTENSVAFNLGKLYGIRADLQLLPLLFFWLIAVLSLVHSITKPASIRQIALHPLSVLTVLLIAGLAYLPTQHRKLEAQVYQRGPGLAGTYIHGIAWDSLPTRYHASDYPEERILFRTVDKRFDFDWHAAGPPVQSQFSTEWKGFIDIEEAGTYAIGTRSDDGSAVYIDGKLFVDNWGIHKPEVKGVKLFLTEGLHPIVVRYTNILYGCAMQLMWAKPGEEKAHPIPPEILSHPPQRGQHLPDFSGDGKADAVLFRPLTGEWYFNPIGGTALTAYKLGRFGDIPAPADFDGDGITDASVFRHTTGQWFWRSSAANKANVIELGDLHGIPVPADYDGDGVIELGVFEQASGRYTVIDRVSGKRNSAQFGAWSGVPVPCDYDGDGNTDAAVYNPANSIWQISTAQGLIEKRFGRKDAIPVPADYLGDGICDVAVWHPAPGIWDIEGFTEQIVYGQKGDFPAVADFDGDGDDDIAVWRPQTFSWHWRHADGTDTVYTFGLIDDLVADTAALHRALTDWKNGIEAVEKPS